MGLRYTELIRYMIDEFLPSCLRENRYFMYPFFRLWFRGESDISSLMEFKKNVHSMTDEEFRQIYANFENMDSDRVSDSSAEAMNWVLQRIDNDNQSLIDIGCGKGAWLRKCSHLPINRNGLDIFANLEMDDISYIQGNVDNLPFSDQSFDVVTSFFVLEHVRNVEHALSELKRITRKHLFIAVPCQRYFKYTFDLHLHFFYSAEYFKSIVGIKNAECEQLGGNKIGHILYHADLT